MYSAVTTSHKYFPLRASLRILSISPAPPSRRYFTLMEGYLSSKLFRIRPTIDPPVSVPYQTTSPSFFAFSTDEGVCWANATGVSSKEITRADAIIKTLTICIEGIFHTLLRHLLWLGLGIRVLEAQLYPTAAADVNTRQFVP